MGWWNPGPARRLRLQRILTHAEKSHWARVHGDEMSFDESAAILEWDLMDAWRMFTGREWDKSKWSRMTEEERENEIRRRCRNRPRATKKR